MVVVLELSFNFAPTPNESLRLTRIRKSYVNRSAVILTNHRSYAAQSGHVPLFCSCLFPVIVHLRNLLLLKKPVAENAADSNVGK